MRSKMADRNAGQSNDSLGIQPPVQDIGRPELLRYVAPSIKLDTWSGLRLSPRFAAAAITA